MLQGALLVLCLCLCLALAPDAHAEASWLGAHGRVPTTPESWLWTGTRSVGVGLSLPEASSGAPKRGAPPVSRSLDVEASWAHADRFLELRGGRRFGLRRGDLAATAAQLGVSTIIVPDRAPDVGAGPHASLSLALGSRPVSLDLALSTGLEVFARGALRLPQRLSLSVSGRLGAWALVAAARAGADVRPGRYFVGRGELALALGCQAL